MARCSMCLFALALARTNAEQLRVGCAGDSIVAGSKVVGSENFWPAVLDDELNWATVGNYGNSGRTIGTDKPWYRSEFHCEMLHDGFDVAIVALGTNDAKEKLKDERTQIVTRYQHLINDLVRLMPSVQAIFLCAPVPMLKEDGDWDADSLRFINRPPNGDGVMSGYVEDVVAWAQKGLANIHVGYIDNYAAMRDAADTTEDDIATFYDEDGIHPNAKGARVLALSAKGALDAWYDNNAPRDPKDWGWPTCDDPGTRSFTLEAKDGNPAAKCVFRGQLMEGGVRYDLISTTPGRLSYKNVGEMGVVYVDEGLRANFEVDYCPVACVTAIYRLESNSDAKASIYVPGRIKTAGVVQRLSTTVESREVVNEESNPDTSSDNWGFYKHSWLWVQGGLRADVEVEYCTTTAEPASCDTTLVELVSVNFGYVAATMPGTIMRARIFTVESNTQPLPPIEFIVTPETPVGAGDIWGINDDGNDVWVKDGLAAKMYVTHCPGPTAEPTTPQPTYEPTHEPSSYEPTYTPTDAPTDAPTKAPTKAPTEAPTKAPTEAPTEAPTDAPTDRPTETPTETPTTATPTETPTDTPTDTPTICEDSTSYQRNGRPERTCVPWVASNTDIRCGDEELIECRVTCGTCPSEPPTNAPTDIPTEAPTETPTGTPTDMPTICEDSASYRRNGKPGRTCVPWVAANTDKRCGDEELIECRVTCGTCPEPPTDAPTDALTDAPTDPPTDPPTDAPTDAPTAKCDLTDPSCCDSTSWLLSGDTSRGCAWVSDKTGKRCSKGDAETECRASCGTC